jgi:hypothetical protein
MPNVVIVPGEFAIRPRRFADRRATPDFRQVPYEEVVCILEASNRSS